MPFVEQVSFEMDWYIAQMHEVRYCRDLLNALGPHSTDKCLASCTTQAFNDDIDKLLSSRTYLKDQKIRMNESLEVYRQMECRG